MADASEPAPIRNILVCYDGSPQSEHALARAAELARAPHKNVAVISVADPIYRTAPFTGYAGPDEEDAHNRLLAEAKAKLSAHGISATTTEQVGSAADVIVEVAHEAGADLIVVGSRHRGLLQRLLFGSVSGALVVEAPCDVLVVR
jgi:nucleotide-binding universal stress UspA family protein